MTNEAIPQNPMQPAIQGYRKFDQATSDYINSGLRPKQWG